MTLIERPEASERFLAWTDWEGYLHALEAFKHQRIKITYDRGRLELLTPSFLHEGIKTYLRQLVEAACFEMEVDYRPGGSTTFRHRLAERGLEPDECYFFSQFPEPETYDPEVGPWPDLALEIEVTRSALDRMAIYRDLSVREVWRYSALHEICIERLGPDGYSVSKTSIVLPGLKVCELPRFVQLGFQDGPRAMLKAFKPWLSL
ncbi:hypothetical protein DYH09_00320 [bacterium CPR1]|nr:hypothetical protein [bacterium CPR1]